jgi:mannitol-1-phosphate 5-dehydrogenase
MGDIFTAAGYEVVFADVVQPVVEGLNERRSYPLRLAGPDRFETLTIGPVRAVDARNTEAVAEELARCDFACTAVGVPALPRLAPALAAGVKRRSEPLNVILCENQLNCSGLLRGYLARELTPDELRRVGLVESVVSRMVPVVSEAERAADPLLAVAEDYPALPVDASAFLGAAPAVPAFRSVADFPAYVERKLFVHNMGHAVSAYLGYRAGCTRIAEALARSEIAETVTQAMQESGEALCRKHDLDRTEMRDHRENLLRRFANPALGDTVARVAKDPVRKLRPDDRLVGAALTCLDWSVDPAHIVRGIAAAFRYDAPDDPAAAIIQDTLQSDGLEEAIRRFTGQRAESDLGSLILEAWGRPDS